MLSVNEDFGYDKNPEAQADFGNRGNARAWALPGTGAEFALPVLKARAEANGPTTSTAYVLAFQGYKNTGDVALDLAFAGLLDFTATTSFGMVRAGLAVVTDAVRDPKIGELWVNSAFDGAFTATCGTPGAIAISQGPQLLASGPGTATVDTATGTCGGGQTFSIAPGQTFYVTARLLAFQNGLGVRDASNTFNVELSQAVSAETRALLPQALVPVALAPVPEPATWAMMMLGFGGVGFAMRRKQTVGARVRFA